jgi:hypothetical protein
MKYFDPDRYCDSLFSNRCGRFEKRKKERERERERDPN